MQWLHWQNSLQGLLETCSGKDVGLRRQNFLLSWKHLFWFSNLPTLSRAPSFTWHELAVDLSIFNPLPAALRLGFDPVTRWLLLARYTHRYKNTTSMFIHDWVQHLQTSNTVQTGKAWLGSSPSPSPQCKGLQVMGSNHSSDHQPGNPGASWALGSLGLWVKGLRTWYQHLSWAPRISAKWLPLKKEFFFLQPSPCRFTSVPTGRAECMALIPRLSKGAGECRSHQQALWQRKTRRASGLGTAKAWSRSTGEDRGLWRVS